MEVKLYTDGKRVIQVIGDDIPYYNGRKLRYRTSEVMKKPLNQKAMKDYKPMVLATPAQIKKLTNQNIELQKSESVSISSKKAKKQESGENLIKNTKLK